MNDEERKYHKELIREIAIPIAETVVKTRRYRLVVSVAIVTFVITLGCSGVAAYFISRASNDNSVTNARYNCGLLSTIAEVTSQFITLDIKDREGGLSAQEKTEVLNSFKFIPNVKRLADKQQNLDRETFTKWKILSSELLQLGYVNCKVAIR